MKKMLWSVVALGLLSSTAMAGGRTSDKTVVDPAFQQLDRVAQTLTPAQRDSLSTVKGDDADQVMAQIHQILTPAQSRAFDQAAVTLGARNEVYPQNPGYYLPWGCFTVSKLGVIMSMVGYIGCPSDTSRSASVYAWSASTYSSTCVLEQTESCPSAMGAAYSSAGAWGQLLGTCSVADSAYYFEQATFRMCGGAREDEATPTPAPVP